MRRPGAINLDRKPMRSETDFATLSSSYRFQDLMKFFNVRRESYHTNPQLIDEVIYTPYSYKPAIPQTSQGTGQGTEIPPTGDLLGTPDLLADNGSSPHIRKRSTKFTEPPTQAEIFLFEYGTVVIWGMTETEEKRFLSSMCDFSPSSSHPIHSQASRKRFEVERLGEFRVELLSVTGFRLRYALETSIIIRRSGCANLMGSPGGY